MSQASGGSEANRGRGSAADWLCLAAAPTFLAMALLTAAFGGAMAGSICSAARGWPLGGMVPMYLLMGAFHAAPWLRLIARWRG
jgi:hypothetical protein